MSYFKTQINLMLKRTSFKVSLSAMCLGSVLFFIINCIQEYGKLSFNVHAAKYMFLCGGLPSIINFIFSIIFPLVVVIPFSDTFFEERKNKTVEFCLIRYNNSAYYFSKLLAVFFSGFIIIFIPFVLNYLLNFIAFPLDSSIDYTNISISNSGVYSTGINTLVLFKNLFAKNMYIYNFLHILLMSVTGAFMAVIVYQFSFFYKSSRIILLCSFFVIYQLYNIALSGTGLNSFCIINYMLPSSFFTGQSILGLALTYTLLILTAILPIPFAKRKLREIYG